MNRRSANLNLNILSAKGPTTEKLIFMNKCVRIFQGDIGESNF